MRPWSLPGTNRLRFALHGGQRLPLPLPLPLHLHLHLQLVIASSIILALTLVVTTWWNVSAQRQQLQADITRQARGLARTAALASRYLVIADKFDELESLLLRLALYPDLMELVVTDPAGRVLSNVRASEQGPVAAFDNLQRFPPTLSRRNYSPLR